MKCPACGFENMPGLQRCVRCSGALNLAGIDIEPPRASGPAALRHTRYRIAEVFGRFTYGISRAWHSLRLPNHVSGAHAGALMLSIVPGLGQIVLRQRAVGCAFLVVWCLLMVLSLLGYGSSAGGWCRAGAVILHATAVALVLRPAVKWEGWASRLLIGVGVVLILQMTLYHGLNLLTRGFVGVLPVSGISETALVRNNDVVLYTGGWTRPDRFERGNLVVCRLERGYGIDRVIGLPGEHIAVKGGQVYINGLPVPDGVEPLCGASQFPDFGFEVEPGHVAVLPSNLHWVAQGENAQRLLVQLLNRNSHIRESDVLGVAVWRLRPFGRFGAME